MTQKKKLAEFTLADGETTFLVEVPEPINEDVVEEVSVLDEPLLKAKESFEAALDKVIPVASAAMGRLKKASADEVEVKFGLNLSADAGVIFSSVGSEVTFEITMKWGK
ncbi:MAG: CU044_2847 family protein [Cyanobacteria bacterium P01_H01_bin.26]